LIYAIILRPRFIKIAPTRPGNRTEYREYRRTEEYDTGEAEAEGSALKEEGTLPDASAATAASRRHASAGIMMPPTASYAASARAYAQIRDLPRIY